MKVAIITTRGLEAVKTVIVKGHHNVRHGLFKPGFVSVQLGVNDKIVNAIMTPSPVELADSNYMLSPVIKGDMHMKARSGNYLYYIDTSEDMHVPGYIGLWDIPNIKYTNVKYTLNGAVDLIAEGTKGKIRGNAKYESPALILEITGSMTLTWSADDENDERISQVITYDGKDEWVFGDINIITDKL